ncbi:MAG TPA: fibronectin type III domain-containing protein [Bacteroidetes bacterium]|nr:fibronectin type III domain-containing protein [Bacteroidota bacterium]
MLTKNIPSLFKTIGLSTFLSTTLMAATPATPGSYVGVYNITDSTARISFADNSTDESGFKVYIHDEHDVLDTTLPVNPIIIPANSGPEPFQYATLTNLSPHTLYLLHISAFNADGESTKTIPSSENNGRIKTSPAACQPAMPGGYVGTYNITNTSARISFLDNSDNEEGFKVRVFNSNTNALVKIINVPSLAGTGNFQYANITGLTADTLYHVVVTASSSACGDSDPTHPSSLNNGRFKTTNAPCPTMPGAYVGTYNVTNNSARISFIDNADNETGFKVYVYEAGTNTLVKTVTASSVAGVGGYQYVNITGLNANTLYNVKVSAFNAGCESTKTTPSSVNNGRFTTLP